MLNDSVVDVAKIDAAVEASGMRGKYEASLRTATFRVAASFLLSAGVELRAGVADFQKPPGNGEFNAEVGRMTALSFPVIALPTMVVFVWAMCKFFSALTECTGLKLEDVVAKDS